METIPKSDCTCIGYFQKPYGINGELLLIFEERYYDSLEKITWFFVEIDGLLVPYRLPEEGIRIRSNTSAIVALDWCSTQEYARRLTGKKVFISNNEVVTDPETLRLDDLKGFEVYGTKEGLIGQIIQADNYAGNIVLTVSDGNAEHLIPYNDDLVESVNTHSRKIIINVPEGLIR